MKREPNTVYVLSLSYGKDSLACLDAIQKLGYPLDRIIHAEVWATKDIPADLPPMVEFKRKADEIILQRYGIVVEHFCATKRRERERERITYSDLFYESHNNEQYGEHINGFPRTLGGWCHRLKYNRETDIRRYILSACSEAEYGEREREQNLRLSHPQRELVYEQPQTTGFATRWSQYCTGELKKQPLTDFQSQYSGGIGVRDSNNRFSSSTLAQGANTNIVQYLGIAADEPERIKRHTKPGYILPLVDIGWDEAYCRKWCEENDLLSPIYTTSTRGGCWFCHNQGIPQLRLLRRDYPDLWQLLLKWDSDSPVSFHPDGRTVHDFDKRFAMEDAGLIDPNKRFYWKYLDKGELQMATKKTETPIETATMNVWQKLLASRMDFLKQKVKQSGVNLHAEFTYFELKDIVPVATDIFAKYNCVFLTTFPEGKAVGKLVNLDNIEEIITVEFEARSIAEPAKFRMNEVQGLGAEITYMRRYLYFLILDIVVADDFDGESGKKTEDDDVPAPTTTKKKPVTAEKREEIKQELTSPEANADELQINALKAALRNLREIDPSKEEFIQQIALKTEGFTVIKKSACEQLILTIGEMIENYNIEEE